jgi:hypothetical protein
MVKDGSKDTTRDGTQDSIKRAAKTLPLRRRRQQRAPPQQDGARLRDLRGWLAGGHGPRAAAGRAFTYRGLRGWLQRLGERASVPRAHLHLFRHTSAVDTRDAGAALRTVQLKLSHASIATQRYLNRASQRLSERQRAFSPVDHRMRRRRGRRGLSCRCGAARMSTAQSSSCPAVRPTCQWGLTRSIHAMRSPRLSPRRPIALAVSPRWASVGSQGQPRTIVHAASTASAGSTNVPAGMPKLS